MTAPYTRLEKGTLLISSPDVDQGIYSRSVVLICEHTTVGSFGLMINKPFQIELTPELATTKELSHPKVKLRLGGKMQQNQMLLLHSSPAAEEGSTLKVLDGVYLGGDLQFLQDSINDDSCNDIIICFGYTSWITGELEREFMNGLWFPSTASQDLVFHTDPDKLWQTTLRQMGGKYTSISMIPEDLSLN